MKTSSVAAAPVATVDAQNPWLGLVSFTEETRGYFHGREEEAAELGRRVQRKLLTVLFGQSGLGKTSILQAGLVPRLRPEGFCPVYVRLDYDPNSPSPAEQIKRAVFKATEAAGTWTQSGSAVSGETLWEFLHHRDDVLRDAAGRTLIPILIFDQFEEIFTLAQTDDAGRHRAQEFLADLADLVENRPPAALESRIERDEADAAKFDFARADYRILISLREDYLAHLEGLKAQMPSVTQNRMRLARMTGAQAVAAVRAPAPQLVSEAVAEAVVRFVAGTTDLAHAEVEPSLLSLICRELNNTRLAKGEAEISAVLLAGSRDTILSEFYERALADQPPGVRIFIEDEMLTDSGFRESVAEERVRKGFVAAGAAPDALALLVNRRLLRVEDRLDLRRVEITHDVLCSVIGASRGVRHEREALEESKRQLAAQHERELATHRALVRARAIAAVAVVLMLLAGGSAVFGWINYRRARVAEAEAQNTRRFAESARAEAEKLVGFLLEDFYDELEPTGRLETVQKLAQQAVKYYDGLPPELKTPQTLRYRGMALVRQGAATFLHGNAKEADPELAEARAIFEKLQADGDKSEETAVGLALSIFGNAEVGVNLLAKAPDLAHAADIVRPFATSPHGSRRAKRVYTDILNFLCHTQPPEQAIATCEEARKILAAIGATDVSDLGAATAYADIGDSEARHALILGRLDDAERLELEVDALAERVLIKRPGDLRAMEDRWYAPDVLADIAMRHFDYAKAEAFAKESVTAGENYIRFNPANSLGWELLSQGQGHLAAILEQQGKVSEAAAMLRAVTALERDPRNTVGLAGSVTLAWVQLVRLEAQLGHFAEAERALKEYERVGHAYLAQIRASDSIVRTANAGMANLRCRIHLYKGENAEAAAGAMENLRIVEAIPNPAKSRFINDAIRNTLALIVEAEIRLGRFEEAGAMARKLKATPPVDAFRGDVDDIIARVDILLAQTIIGQGRRAEAREALASALGHYGAQKEMGAAHVDFLGSYARCLYVLALTEPEGVSGLEARRADLARAASLMAAMPPESAALIPTRELAGWIAAAQAKAEN